MQLLDDRINVTLPILPAERLSEVPAYPDA
jgi:hypothetical protein